MRLFIAYCHSDMRKLLERQDIDAVFIATPDLEAHHRNFFDSIRTGTPPNADIETGHLSSTLCHLGNIATRTGRMLHFDPETEMFREDQEADALTGRHYRDHWAAPHDA